MVTLLPSSRGFTQDAFDAFLAGREEPGWLVALRRQAWEAFLEMPLPDRKLEEWMRTDIRGFRFEQFGLPASVDAANDEPGRADHAAAGQAKSLLRHGVDLGGSFVSIDSGIGAADLDPALAQQGVWFGSLDRLMASAEGSNGAPARSAPEVAEKQQTVVKSIAERIRTLLFSAIDARADKFAALHAACWSDGGVLYVPKGVVVDRPLHMLSVLSPGGVDFSHALIVLEDGAEATVLAETTSLDAAASGLHCGAIEIHVGRGARLRYVNLQDWGTGVWHFAHQHARVDREGSLQWTIGALGSRLAKVNQHVSLIGPNSETQVNGVMFTEGKQHLSYHTLQHHQAPGCRSDLLYKGALQDKSRLVWRGMIKVDRDAQKTDGYQRNDNLVLSADARADSIPGLEIEADDVKCSHGATAGCIDDELVFYACCRGLSRKEAIRLVVTGFFQQVFDRVTIESVRRALGDAVGQRIREYD